MKNFTMLVRWFPGRVRPLSPKIGSENLHRTVRTTATSFINPTRAFSTSSHEEIKSEENVSVPTKPKQYSDIPGDWKGKFPLVGALPLFLPYFEKEEGAMRFEDFLYDQYITYGKRTGVCRWGGFRDKSVLVFDVEAYLNILRQEGKYPTGILQGTWPIIDYNRLYLEGLSNPFVAHGEEWRKGRMAINPYIFNIQAARSYLEAINSVSSKASAHFEEYAVNGKFDRFCELAAFDMFMAASLGLVLDSVAGNPDGLKMVNKINGGFGKMSEVASQCPYSKIDALKFNTWNKFAEQWKLGRDASKELVKMAIELGQGNGKGIMHGFLTDPNLEVSDEEAIEMHVTLTFAAADTTSSQIFNVLTNMARYPHVQDKVRDELKEELGGKDYNPDVKLPYLEQALKESQRLTPPLPWIGVKQKIHQDVTVAGYHVPEGSTVILSNMGIKHDETYAGPDPLTFNPDRYSNSAVKARKGTKAEVLDHPICTKPFGFGARMCVGSRVARLEYMSLICRILQDYQVEYDFENSAPTVRLTKATTMDYPCPRYRITKLKH